MDISPIPGLLAALSNQQRQVSLSLGGSVRRFQRSCGWNGEIVVMEMGISDLLVLPVLDLSKRSIAGMGMGNYLRTHHPGAVAMIYQDQDDAWWCLRMNGPGIPPLQGDLFRQSVKVVVLI